MGLCGPICKRADHLLTLPLLRLTSPCFRPIQICGLPRPHQDRLGCNAERVQLLALLSLLLLMAQPPALPAFPSHCCPSIHALLSFSFFFALSDPPLLLAPDPIFFARFSTSSRDVDLHHRSRTYTLTIYTHATASSRTRTEQSRRRRRRRRCACESDILREQ